MNENVTLVFQGFLNLPNLEKLKLVEALTNISIQTNARQFATRTMKILSK